jgi:excinuclease UvrABC helicase subunit UvrB
LALSSENKLKKYIIMPNSFRRIDEILRRMFENPDNFDFEQLEKMFTKRMLSKPYGDNIKLNFVYVSDSTLDDVTENDLEQELKQAVESENFERAIEIRDELKKLELNKEKIQNLEIELKEAIQKQDFEKCIIIRDELNKLKTK